MEPSECIPMLTGPALVIGVICVFVTGFIIGAMIVKGDPDPFGEDAHPGPK